MFMHGGWMHIIGNMLYLWIFGNNIEDRLGHVRFVLFYLLCGAAAALAQIPRQYALRGPDDRRQRRSSPVCSAPIWSCSRARMCSCWCRSASSPSS